MTPTSSNPSPAPADRASVAVDLGRAGRADDGVAISIDGAPPAATYTVWEPDGSVAIVTDLVTRLLGIDGDDWDVDSCAHVRAILPRAIDAMPLLGKKLRIRTTLVLVPGRAPTHDAVVTDLDGALVLWTRDGGLPRERGPMGLGVLAAHDERGARLVVRSGPIVTSLAAGHTAEVITEQGTFTVLAARVGRDDAAFVAVRR